MATSLLCGEKINWMGTRSAISFAGTGPASVRQSAWQALHLASSRQQSSRYGPGLALLVHSISALPTTIPRLALIFLHQTARSLASSSRRLYFVLADHVVLFGPVLHNRVMVFATSRMMLWSLHFNMGLHVPVEKLRAESGACFASYLPKWCRLGGLVACAKSGSESWLPSNQ
jgi:hypothetical protein